MRLRKTNWGSIFMQTFSAHRAQENMNASLCLGHTQSHAALGSLKLELVENPFHVKDFQKTLLYSLLVYRKPGLYGSSLLLDSISVCEFLCRCDCEHHLINGRQTKNSVDFNLSILQLLYFLSFPLFTLA